MKDFLLIVFCMLICNTMIAGDNESVGRYMYGLTLGNNHYQQYRYDNKQMVTKWDELFTSSSVLASFDVYKQINQLTSWRTGLSFSGINTVVSSDSLSVGVAETFLTIPISCNFVAIQSRIGFNPVNLGAGLGINYSLLTRQNLFVSQNEILPFETEIKTGGYSKLSTMFEFNTNIAMSDGMVNLILGWRFGTDFVSFLKSKKVVFTPSYFSWGFYTSIILNLKAFPLP